jgi:hypothetical protein
MKRISAYLGLALLTAGLAACTGSPSGSANLIPQSQSRHATDVGGGAGPMSSAISTNDAGGGAGPGN